MSSPLAVLAFSGGLDTSWAVLALQRRGYDVATVTVDTGGFGPGELDVIAARAGQLGVTDHRTVDARETLYRRFLGPLIRGNVLRGGTYPLSVSAERTVQAEELARVARECGAGAVAHGSTGAGNDQVRFDVALRTLVPDMEILTPIRDQGVTRDQETQDLKAAGIDVASTTRTYSVNDGLWGRTIGGGRLHDPWEEPPEDVYSPVRETGPTELVLGFEAGLPVSLEGSAIPERVSGGLAVVEALRAIGGAHGVGRGVHLGETILGIKGRIAFEAPAPAVLIPAHRELEKLVLTPWQAYWKDALGDFYGQQLHRGLGLDPVMHDLEALFASASRTVCGEVRVRLSERRVEVLGCRSPYSPVDAAVGVYGETSRMWDGDEARAFAKLFGLSSMLAHRATQRSGDNA